MMHQHVSSTRMLDMKSYLAKPLRENKPSNKLVDRIDWFFIFPAPGFDQSAVLFWMLVNYCGAILYLLFLQGEQKSPGIIPLAVKDVFGIIQEVVDYSACCWLWLKWIFWRPAYLHCHFQTPGREFLLRVSYLEIYNEVSQSPFTHYEIYGSLRLTSY